MPTARSWSTSQLFISLGDSCVKTAVSLVRTNIPVEINGMGPGQSIYGRTPPNELNNITILPFYILRFSLTPARARAIAEDVVNFLASRHGIKVDVSYVEENLMPGLAGATGESPDAVFDIVELATILLIPHLRKEAAFGHDMLFAKVVQIILADVNDSTEPVVLDKAFMIRVLERYGEDDIPDEVIEEMLQAAGASEGKLLFDDQMLAQATTGDVHQVELEWEGSATTHYDDALDGTALDANLEDNDPDEEIQKSEFDEHSDQIKRIFTFPTIDYVAENYRSKGFNVVLWVVIIVAFFAYAFQFQTNSGA